MGCKALTKNPNTGTCAFSALLTPHGRSISKDRNKSKNDVWGAAANIVASLLVALTPLVLTRWKPKQNLIALPMYRNDFLKILLQPFIGSLLNFSCEQPIVIIPDITNAVPWNYCGNNSKYKQKEF